MKQVKFRSVLLLLLIVLLGLGLALFCLRYTFRGEAWASFSANGHAYTDGVVRTGQVLDRNGTVLYDGPSGVYHEDSALRQATLHAVGDQLGNISTSALEAFQSRLIGFDPLTGTLSGGHKVYLTIDADLSRTAWEALDGRKGVAAVYNYQTGDILCMVSNPSFDPADPPEISDDDSDYEGVYLNRLLSGLYTPAPCSRWSPPLRRWSSCPAWRSAPSPATAASPSGIRSSPVPMPTGRWISPTHLPAPATGCMPSWRWSWGRRFAGLRPAGGAAGGLLRQRHPHGLRAVHRRERRRSGLVRRGTV